MSSTEYIDTSQVKKARLSTGASIDYGAPDPTRRKQVDAHVQAFLKAVLNSAHGGSAQSAGKKCLTKEKRDASTQTDEVGPPLDTLADFEDVLPSHSDNMSTHMLSCSQNGGSFGNSVSSACVPNRSMYSMETLNLFSEKDIHHVKAQNELSSDLAHVDQYYTTSESTQPLDHPSDKVTSGDFRRVINQWVEKYEQWFYQNFGVNVRTMSTSAASNQKDQLDTVATSMQVLSNAPLPVSATASSQSSVVVSGAPVSYVVPEGSICMPDNRQFSPYVSLLPSFYTPAAFNHTYPVAPTYQALPVTGMTTLVQYSHPSHLSAFSLPSVCATPTIVGVTDSSVHIPTLFNLPAVSLQCSAPSVTAAPVADLSSDIQTSAMLAALSLPLSSCRHPSMGQWGPLLRYGTYGRLPSAEETESLNIAKTPLQTEMQLENCNTNASISKSPTSPDFQVKKMPPPPPTFILLRRQAMICALQLSCRDRSRELFLREKESKSGIKVDYICELEQLVEKTIDVKPVVLFTKLNQLPASERAYFLSDRSPPATIISYFHGQHATDRVTHQNAPVLGRSFSVEDMYVCDLLIGDVLIAEACSTFKLQAQRCAARQAFRILSQPCFLVGSIRVWEAVEYLVLCLSPKAELVPQLPPFLSDPFEPLSKKDTNVNMDKPDEAFEVVNPKPADDLWLFIAKLPVASLDDEAYTDRILAQSAEFSQITISFEVEVNLENGLFSCSVLVDDERNPPVSSFSVTDVLRLASKDLLQRFRLTQPIVAVESDSVGMSCTGFVDSCLSDPIHSIFAQTIHL